MNQQQKLLQGKLFIDQVSDGGMMYNFLRAAESHAVFWFRIRNISLMFESLCSFLICWLLSHYNLNDNLNSIASTGSIEGHFQKWSSLN